MEAVIDSDSETSVVESVDLGAAPEVRVDISSQHSESADVLREAGPEDSTPVAEKELVVQTDAEDSSLTGVLDQFARTTRNITTRGKFYKRE